MRIGLVCPYSLDTPGGVQNHVLGLAGWLQRSGHEPHILAPGRISRDQLTQYGLAPNRVVSTGGTIPVRWNGSVARIAGGPRTAQRVRRWLHDTASDIVHIHEPMTPSAGFWALAHSRVPVVATFHLATPRSAALALAGRILAPMVQRIAVPLAVSPTAAAVVFSHLGLQPRIVPNGIEAADFAGPRTTNNGPRALFLGRLTEPRKGLEVLLQAVPTLRAHIPGIDIVIAGPGERSLPEGVLRVGAPSDRDRAELLRSADVFIAPHTGRESFGLVLLEAMAAGTPVVAADLDAFVAVLTDDTGVGLGRTFPVGDSAALAAAVIETLTDPPADPAPLVRRAEAFDWSRIGPRVVSAYAEALGGQ